MTPRVIFITLLLACVGAAHAAPIVAPTVSKFSFGRFGETTIYKPQKVLHAAMFFSDERGWSASDAALAIALAERGVLVTGIDLRHYAAELSKPRSKCSYLAGEFEDFSHELQKHYSPERYHLPVLIGKGAGAALVYAVAAQGSSGTFVGTVTMGFHPRWRPPLKLCQSYELRYAVGPDGVTVLKPSPELSTPWVDLHAAADVEYPRVELDKFIQIVDTARAVLVATDDVHVDDARKWREALAEQVMKLAAPDREPTVYSGELSDLPLEEVRAQGTPTTRMALFLTGDGGWAEIDKSVSNQLAARGIDVVALSSLQYFWKPRSPDQTAKDVGRVLRHYLAVWSKRDVMVVGYSFGADVAAFVVNRLPQDLQSRIASVSLLGLATTADFEVHVTTWLGVDHHGLATTPEVNRLDVPVLCVYGEGETDSACGLLKNINVRAIKIGDGHHFGDRYREIADAIMALGRTRSANSER